MHSCGILGIDVGGTGIKAALVDPVTGALLTEKHKVLTPKPATPAAVSAVIRDIIDYFSYSGPVGCGFPSVIERGIVRTATNLDSAWIGSDISALFARETGLPFTVLNDADAAGIAEVRFGAARDCRGVTVMITVGTGVGSGLFIDQQLVPNTELGFLPLRGDIAEKRISNTARKKQHLGWSTFGKRLNEYLMLVETLFHPELIVLGGGVCKQYDLFSNQLRLRKTEIRPATLLNNAGCIGAAWSAG